MVTKFDPIIKRLKLDVRDSITLPARPARLAPIPEILCESPAVALPRQHRNDGQLWQHQAEALTRLTQGENVVTATGTASGKSLIFQTYALHLLAGEPEATVLAFYPLKALAKDQLASWQRAAADVTGVSPQAIVHCDGDTTDRAARVRAVSEARVLITTPDWCHAWLLANLKVAEVSDFLRRLRLIIIDEAHEYESVFGSHSAFLFRRLIAAHNERADRPIQITAATATILNPAEHLQRLTGLPFTDIDEKSDGAPRHERRIVHVAGPGTLREAEGFTADLLQRIGKIRKAPRFIAFINNRQAVERITKATGRFDVLPYRSGYLSQDRASIQESLSDGQLLGVVTTSALELGIDLPDLTVGLNVGLPISRKSFRQRLGRIGRSQPGLFILVAPIDTFAQYGDSLEDYYHDAVEPSFLYVNNEYIQYAHAMCLLRERRRPNDLLDPAIDWPGNFAQIYGNAIYRDAPRFEHLEIVGAKNPHGAFPLRNLVEANFELVVPERPRDQQLIGSIQLPQAMREAYPGANYMHYRDQYRVSGWRHQPRGYRGAIQLEPTPVYHQTYPEIRRSISVSAADAGVRRVRRHRHGRGYLAEVGLTITDEVIGYSKAEGAADRNPTLYLYERLDDPGLEPQTRTITTTGVILAIDEPWFRPHGNNQLQVAQSLHGLLCHRRSYSREDVGFLRDTVNVDAAGLPAITPYQQVVIYDNIYGSFRMTAQLFNHFDRYVETIARAATMSEQSSRGPRLTGRFQIGRTNLKYRTDAADSIAKDTANLLQKWTSQLEPL